MRKWRGFHSGQGATSEQQRDRLLADLSAGVLAQVNHTLPLKLLLLFSYNQRNNYEDADGKTLQDVSQVVCWAQWACTRASCLPESRNWRERPHVLLFENFLFRAGNWPSKRRDLRYFWRVSTCGVDSHPYRW